MIGLDNLTHKKGSRKRKTRLGLGHASGKGRSCTKGQKGQTSRSGNTRKESKEGGQMPLLRRIPKSGFSNAQFANKFEYVNVSSLSKFASGEEVTPQSLKSKNIIKSGKKVKILGEGAVSSAFKVSAHSFSKSAKEKIEKSGGSVTVLENKSKKQEKKK